MGTLRITNEDGLWRATSDGRTAFPAADYYDPRDFGADPEGREDASAAWNECITAAVMNGVTRVRAAGKYLIDSAPVAFPKDFTIEGPLPLGDNFGGSSERQSWEDGLCFFAGPNLDGPVLVGYMNPEERGDPEKWIKGFLLTNFFVDGNKAGRAGKRHPLISIWQPGEGSLIENVAVYRSTASGIRIEGTANPVRMKNITAFHNDRMGIELAASSGGTFIDGAKGDWNTLGVIGATHQITYTYGATTRTVTGNYSAHLDAKCSGENNGPISLFGYTGSLTLLGGRHTWGTPGTSFIDVYNMVAGQEPTLFIDGVHVNNTSANTIIRVLTLKDAGGASISDVAAPGAVVTVVRTMRQLALTNSSYENLIHALVPLSTQVPAVTGVDGLGVLGTGFVPGVREQFSSSATIRSIEPWWNGRRVAITFNTNGGLGKSFATVAHNNAPAGYPPIFSPTGQNVQPDQRTTLLFEYIGDRWQIVS